ncbi:GNAT family N-acetyltransferase [Modicisalibacter coralii]|uniref:GNAT family N-acetyltransferase n=1 Tax=Modicisalibacter coralii TaxID=2304602 RepID=UPI00100BE7D5|nr:GNAT family N-acetyltransferase [Halomonas coralii]
MDIEYLRDVPETIPVLAEAMAAHWERIVAGESFERRKARLEAHAQYDGLPIAWVAMVAGQPVATSALRVCDLDGREDLTPWLAGVFVMPEYRGRGIASKVCEVAERQAWSWNVETLYLHTPDQQALYRKRGWRRLETADWNGVETTIMTKPNPNA